MPAETQLGALDARLQRFSKQHPFLFDLLAVGIATGLLVLAYLLGLMLGVK